MDIRIGMFLKLGSYENIRDLYENGTIYLNTIQYFRNLEDNELRGDNYEGSTRIVNSLPGTFTIPGVDKEFKYEKVKYQVAYETVLGNIYSLYCISSHGFPNPLDFQVDKRNFKFGTHCLMVKDNQRFLDRIESELKANKFNFTHGFVDYYEKDKVSKHLSLFEKPKEYDYQKEFRFYVENSELKPIKIQIGSLKNYAEIIETKNLAELRLNIKNN